MRLALAATACSGSLRVSAGYGQSWCLVSSSGLVLGLLNGFAVAEVHALDHLGEALRAVQPAPVPLGRLGELEHHGQGGLTRQAALGLVGPQPDGSEGAFDRVAGPDVLPVLGGEVVEGEQALTVLAQADGG